MYILVVLRNTTVLRYHVSSPSPHPPIGSKASSTSRPVATQPQKSAPKHLSLTRYFLFLYRLILRDERAISHLIAILSVPEILTVFQIGGNPSPARGGGGGGCPLPLAV